jgi:hypothetical protein
MADKKKEKMKSKEPVFIIRPALKNFGLDYLHITLIALVLILVVLAFALTTFKSPILITQCSNSTNSTAPGNCNNSTSGAIHSSSQALAAAERNLALYSNFNTSLSLLPYYSLVNQSKVDYLANQKEWLVTIPYINPLANDVIYNTSMILYDSNLSLAGTYLESLKPPGETNNSVVGLGTVSLYGRSECQTSKPIHVYVVTDPYAPDAIPTLQTAINASRQYKGTINVSYFFIFSGYSQQFYNGYGVQDTQYMGQYMYCASHQSGFSNFLSNLSIPYEGRPLTNITLYQVVQGSGLNTDQFNNCMQNVSTDLDYQAQFANLYNIQSTPTILVNCKYSTIPQTLNYSIAYALNHLQG